MTYVVVNHTTIWSRPRRAVVVVIIWWCDLQLHMSYITEIQGAVLFLIIWWCDLQLHVIYNWNTWGRRGRDHMVVWFITTYVQDHMITTTTAPCISVIYDICSCKSHHHMVTTTTTPYWNTRGCRGRDHMVVWFTTSYVIYYWNTRGRLGRDHMVVWFTTTYVIYYVVNHTTIWSRPRRPLVF
jgi:hypothetical protein